MLLVTGKVLLRSCTIHAVGCFQHSNFVTRTDLLEKASGYSATAGKFALIAGGAAALAYAVVGSLKKKEELIEQEGTQPLSDGSSLKVTLIQQQQASQGVATAAPPAAGTTAPPGEPKTPSSDDALAASQHAMKLITTQQV